jgi:hypothetical protein
MNRVGVAAGAIIGIALSQAAAVAAPITVMTMTGRIPASLQPEADGNVWFSAIAPNGGGSALGRITPAGVVSYVDLPPMTVNGAASATVPLALAPALPGAPSDRVFFTWGAGASVVDYGIGVLPFADPARVELKAAALPGDPLYSPAVAGQFETFSLLVTGPEARIWSYAKTTGQNAAAAIASLRYPFKATPRYAAAPYGGADQYAQGGAANLVAGRDGHVWFVGPSGIGRVDGTAVKMYSAPGVPAQIAAGDDGNLWAFAGATSGFALTKISYAGDILASYPWPAGGTDFLTLAAGRDALWMTGHGSRFQPAYTRLGYDGQWSWYAAQNPFGATTRLNPTSIAVGANGTVYASYSATLVTPGGVTSAGLITSYAPTRVITATADALALSSGGSARVGAVEQNFDGAFTASIASNNGGNCPLSVTQVSAQTFEVAATDTVPSGCGIEMTDADGFATVWVPVSSK